jgi:hypothetical protein
MIVTKPPRRPCRTCPYHKEARNGLLFGVASVLCVSVAATWAVAEIVIGARRDRPHQPAAPSLVETVPIKIGIGN